MEHSEGGASLSPKGEGTHTPVPEFWPKSTVHTKEVVDFVKLTIAVQALMESRPGWSERGFVMAELRPFHIAFPVDDLAAARHFYGAVLGCPEGRSSEQWIDFSLFGHQIVAHLKSADPAKTDTHSNPVDGHDVPVPHFGVVLTQADWKALAERVKAAGVRFVIEPYTRFEGQVGEQSTMFFLDPAGNALEFKAFADLGQLFAK